MVNEFRRPRCCGRMMVQAYIRHGRRSAIPGIEKIGLYCPRCRLFKEPEHPDFGESIKKYPVLEHVDAALSPYINNVRGLYLHGSRARGDYREDSDYDLVLISQDKIEKDLKAELERYHVQLECFTLKGVKKQLELEPSYLLTVLRQGVPLIGADFQKQLLRKKVNDIALHVEIDSCKKQLKYLKKVIREHKPDDEDKTRIFFSAIMRLRRTYYIKQLYDKDVPPLAENFKRYYKGDFEQTHKLYRKVRNLPLEKDEDLDETKIPEEIKKMSKGALKELVASVDSYIKDFYDELTDKLEEKLELE